MMSDELVAQQLATTAHINTLVARDLVRAWRGLNVEHRLSTSLLPDLFDVVTQIATAYGEVSAVSNGAGPLSPPRPSTQ